MAIEPIYSQRRPGFPRESFSDASYLTEIQYVGLAADLKSASPAKDSVWGEYLGIVSSESLELLDGTEWGILTVVCEAKFDQSSGGETGTEREVAYEIDWTDVQRSMYEHPEFAIGEGGTYELTSEDVTAIGKWNENPNVGYKKDYIYYTGADDYTTMTLSDNAKMFARGIQLGVEYYVYKAPVANRSSSYVNGPPPAGTAGLKEDPVGFPHLPTGYEWLRDADRSLRSGGQTRWQRDTTWIGAKKVLVDAAEIFWDAPE